MKIREVLYFFAAALSGAAWTWLQDLLWHATETSDHKATSAYYLAGAVTGVAVSYAFRRCFRLSGVKFYFLPLATLAFATQVFGLLHWAWLMLYHPPLEPGFLVGVLTTFFIVSFFSWLTPVFYLLALANQSLMRYILLAGNRRGF